MTMIISQAFLFMITLTILRQSGILYSVPQLEFDVFLVKVVLMGFWEEDHRGEVPFKFCHIKDTCYQLDFYHG